MHTAQSEPIQTTIELQNKPKQPLPYDPFSQNLTGPTIRYGSVNTQDPGPSLPTPKKAGFLSLIHFAFAVKIIRLIDSLKNQKVTEEDIAPLVYTQSSQKLENLFTLYYYELRSKYQNKYRLFTFLLYRIFKKHAFIQLALQMLYVCTRILIPYFLYLALVSVRNPNVPIADGYPPAVGMFICMILGVYIFHQFSFNAAFITNSMKIGFLGLMFRKMSKISLFSMQKMSFGKAINIVASDANNLESLYYVFFILITPLTYGGGTVLLLFFWGPSGLVGIGYMLLVFLLQIYLSPKILTPGKRRSFFADERMRKINETLETIRIIKMQGWELGTFDIIKNLRHNETNALKVVTFIGAFERAFTFSAHLIAAFLILLVYTQVGGELLGIKIFPTILLLTYIRQVGLINTQEGLTYISLLKLLFLRTMSIMDLPEVSPPKQIIAPLSPENSVEFHDFSGYWSKKDLGQPPFFKPPTKNPPPAAPPETQISPTPAISNINLNIKKGDLVVLAGMTGCGKSSLLMSFTREMMKTEGELRYAGTFEYVAQEPMILAIPIRDYITFGRSYNEERFRQVVDVCCLTEIIAQMPKKEWTGLGEKGINLSGVQRTQLIMARSLYTKADIYLLDDPLSHFDPKLAKQIFRKAIQEYLRDATVILATNNLNFVKHGNQIVVLDDGKMIAHGTYSEVINQETSSSIIKELKERAKYEHQKIESFGHGRNFEISYASVCKNEINNKEQGPEEEEVHFDMTVKDKGLFLEKELLDDGKVTLKIYWKYFWTIFSWWNIVPFLILFPATEASGWQFLIRTSDWAQGKYSDSEAYGILAGIAFGVLGVYLIKLFFFYNSGLDGCRGLHNKMLRGILLSPLKFFDRNGHGRILNRFVNDVVVLDRFLLGSFLELLEGFCLFIIYLIALWAHQPWILIPAGIAFVCFVVVFLICKKPINQTRGLELTTRGPLYSFFSVVVDRITIVRARNMEENIMRAFYIRADHFSKANMGYRTTIRFMSFVLDYITELAVIGTFCFYIGAKQSPIVNGPFVNMLLVLPTTMQWILKSFINFHSLMASAARILNYCDKHKGIIMVKSGDEKLAQSGWPHDGGIEMQNVSMKYGDNDSLVIRNLSASFKPGEKVAVVGYSSFGMSSLLHVLVKAFNIENKPNAYVKIDNVDIQDIGIALLRKSMTIVPQDPGMFTATLRQNLDPFGKYNDKEIWDALTVAGAKELVEDLDQKLDAYYAKGSSMFSVGQKQLFSVARMLLKKGNIMIQDRATNHTDVITDQIVQKNIKERSLNATYLTTTYRLWTIADFDKVLCLKKGVKVEFDEPYRLLVKEIGDKTITNKLGYFARLVLDMNPKVAKETFKIAMMTYYKRHNLKLEDVDMVETPIHSVNGVETATSLS